MKEQEKINHNTEILDQIKLIGKVYLSAIESVKLSNLSRDEMKKKINDLKSEAENNLENLKKQIIY